ncbi:MAG TPA: ribosomal protein S18-alanine N-acetyltransferase [Mycobacteriales bacterium]
MISPLRWWQLAPVVAMERVLFGDECWSEAAFWSELAQYETRHYVAAWDGEDLEGYAGLAAYRDEAWVQTIGVAPAYQRRGLGAALLDDLMTEARLRGAPTVALEVRADNAPAQELYGRRGFTVAGRRRGYYQPSGVDALIMVAAL